MDFEPLEPRMLENIVSAAGNHEAKALLLAGMRAGKPYDHRELTEVLMGMQGADPAWEFKHPSSRKYCEQSLIPTGLVEKTNDPSEPSRALYELTPLGQTYGRAATGYLLDFSLFHPEISLEKLLGRTAATRPDRDDSDAQVQRSPANRLRIIRELLAADTPLGHKELATRSEVMEGTLLRTIKILKSSGMVEGRSVGADIDISTFSIDSAAAKDRLLEAGAKAPLLRDLLTAILASDVERFSTYEVAGLLSAYGTAYREQPTPNLIESINRALRKLEHDNVVQRDELSALRMSEVSLTTSYRKPLQELLDMLDGVGSSDPDILQFGCELGSDICADKEAVRELLTKARQNSHALNAQPFSETDGQVLSAVQHLGEGTVEIICQEVERTHGVKVSAFKVRKSLARLNSSSQVTSEGLVRRKQAVWKPAPAETS